ncbi:HMA2 domain-containing protein [Methylomonas sp. MgM2]
MNRIVSSVPGRIRVRDKRLRHPARLDQLEAELAKIDAITELQTNVVAGSIVVNFDYERTDTLSLENKIEAAVDAALDAPMVHPKRSMKMRVNRYAKVGMLGSLATSLALAATGRKRGHTVTGGLFVACLGVHLAAHRKSLLR